MWSFGKMFHYFVVGLCFSLPLLGEEDYVSMMGTLPLDSQSFSSRQAKLISELKLPALIRWSEMHLTPIQLELLRTTMKSEEAEDFILSYRLGKISSDKTQMEITFHIDTQSLRKWLRSKSSESKSYFQPVFVVMSDLPYLPLSPEVTPERLKDTPLVKELYQNTRSRLEKYKIRPEAMSGITTSLLAGDIKNLKAWLADNGQNSVLYFQLTKCETCRRPRLNYSFYSDLQSKYLIQKGTEISLSDKILSNPAKLRDLLDEPSREFESEFEELFKTSQLFSAAYCINIENVTSPKMFSNYLETLKNMDDIVSVAPYELGSNGSKFEVLSPLPSEEFLKKLNDEPRLQGKVQNSSCR